MDSTQLMDDSGYRGTVGGCVATSLGSVLHELGHTFDLGHTEAGIMARGFDDLDSLLTLMSERGGSRHLAGDNSTSGLVVILFPVFIIQGAEASSTPAARPVEAPAPPPRPPSSGATA